MNAINNIHFTCSKCGSQRLLIVQSAVHRYVVKRIDLDDLSRLCITEKEEVDILQGDILGYRCGDCRHPDCNGKDSHDGFAWKTLEDVQTAGCISWPGGMETVAHKCLIFFPDDSKRNRHAIVEVSHPGQLSSEERHMVLERENAEGAILISQSDFGIRTLSCSNWKRVRRHILQPTN